MTLRARLAAAFLLVVLVPLLLVTVVVSIRFPVALEKSQERGLGASSNLAGVAVSDLCLKARSVAQTVAWASTAPPPTQVQTVLDSLVDQELADGVRLQGPDGAPLAASGQGPAGTPTQDCAAGRLALVGDQGFVTAVVRLERLPDASGGERDPTAAGTASASFLVDQDLAKQLRGAIGEGDVALLAGGKVLASTSKMNPELLRRSLEAEGEAVRVNGTRARVASVRPGQPVAVLVAERVGPGLSVLPPVLAIVALAAALAALTALFLARAVTRPLAELGDAAAKIAGGDLSATIPVRSRDEVGRAATAFNAMSAELQRYVGALQQSRDELQASVARLGDALAGTHDLPRILGVVLDTALASTGSRAGMVLLVVGEELQLSAGHALESRGVPADLCVPVGAGIAGAVARSGQPVRWQPGDPPRAAPGEPSGTPLVAVPLKSATSVVGVLVVFDRDEPFSEGDLTTLRAFSSQATVAIDNVLLHEEARRQSVTDALTGLFNVRYFRLTVGKEIERAARFGRPLSLLLLDLDHFKRVNDTLGHPRGDAVLVEFADRLRGQVRDVDLLARYGGEEFVVVLPETDQAGAEQVAERIRTAVRREPFASPGEPPVHVTTSIGVAVFPEHGDSASELVRHADLALYAAKDAGRDALRVYAAEGETVGRPH